MTHSIGVSGINQWQQPLHKVHTIQIGVKSLDSSAENQHLGSAELLKGLKSFRLETILQ
jgi:hypothetical protein